MPVLQFDTDFPVAAADADAFASHVTERYTDIMATTAGHVAVVIRDDGHLALGRAVEGRRLFLSADVRAGRDQTRKRRFALAVMTAARDRFDVPEPNLKVAFTEHPGGDLMGYDRVGGSWSPDEQ